MAYPARRRSSLFGGPPTQDDDPLAGAFEGPPGLARLSQGLLPDLPGPGIELGSPVEPQPIQTRETPRERETIPAPVPRQEPSAQTGGPAAPRLSTAGSTTRTPDISPPAMAAGAATGISPIAVSQNVEPLSTPLNIPLAAMPRRMAQPLGGARSLSPMFGRSEGFQGGGLGVPGLTSGQTPDPRIVLKLIQDLLGA